MRNRSQTLLEVLFLELKDILAVMQDSTVDREQVIKVADRKLDPTWIKQREGGGGVTLDYIEGHRVIRLLREATNDRWSFTIVEHFVQPSEPKQMYDYNPKTRRREPIYRRICDNCGKAFHYLKSFKTTSIQCSHCNANNDITLGNYGEPVLEPQPPIVHVLGRLIIPGFGVREQWGSKSLIGGYTEQESAFKSAATDAFKKCAAEFGIALQLWDSEEDLAAREDYIPEDAPNDNFTAPPTRQTQAPVTQAPATPTPNAEQPPLTATNMHQPEPPTHQQPQTAQHAPAQHAQAQHETKTNSTPGNYNPADVAEMKRIKQALGLTMKPEDNAKLNPYVMEFSEAIGHKYGRLTSFTQLVPSILPEFNAWMAEHYAPRE